MESPRNVYPRQRGTSSGRKLKLFSFIKSNLLGDEGHGRIRDYYSFISPPKLPQERYEGSRGVVSVDNSNTRTVSEL